MESNSMDKIEYLFFDKFLFSVYLFYDFLFWSYFLSKTRVVSSKRFDCQWILFKSKIHDNTF